MGVRDDLAQAITDAVQPTYPQVQVYAHPEDVTQLPALVLVPGDPWCRPTTFGGGGAGTVEWQFTLAIAGHRAAVESTITMMEALRHLVEQGLATLGGRWSQLGKPDTIELAGTQAMLAEMDLFLMTERQT